MSCTHVYELLGQLLPPTVTDGLQEIENAQREQARDLPAAEASGRSPTKPWVPGRYRLRPLIPEMDNFFRCKGRNEHININGIITHTYTMHIYIYYIYMYDHLVNKANI
jgi:hypothetical protein